MPTLDRPDRMAPAATDIPLGALLAACDAQPAAPLVFSYAGRTIERGYHVTEVKAGQFAALDCGANPEAWSEIFVQLWDVVDGDRTHMTAGKVAEIIRTVSEHVGLDPGARLTFEVSDGVAPMQLHRADAPVRSGDVLTVALAPRVASCKPRDRWLEAKRRDDARCC
ncbi:DUF6428 family protein [Methylobacterium radiotolerans]|uniref:DUF6428 family protein n=1 Tax=Methylobacterium radiotolerans TaxID=31998 RepID=UPI0007346592|nr:MULTISPECIES: DUF6428 family protein [Methylobacterium]MBE7204534.1 hypothetical protein [Parafilimonas terrae]KTS08022.1 hypothetical protein SB3_16320 [Methylobacterium radiotolerans]KTS45839.1 hypothetical protein SB2_19635 [Methylobacterium radiotolerans]MDE3746418.1 DUF6428 family protein [Methylobacterium radiotolerans]PVZ05125.1 hypothetical protein C7388_105118 [Methylobacterium organophilum]